MASHVNPIIFHPRPSSLCLLPGLTQSLVILISSICFPTHPSQTLLFSCLKSTHGFPLEQNPKTFLGAMWPGLCPPPDLMVCLFTLEQHLSLVQFPSLPFPVSGPMHIGSAISHQPFRSLSTDSSSLTFLNITVGPPCYFRDSSFPQHHPQFENECL